MVCSGGADFGDEFRCNRIRTVPPLLTNVGQHVGDLVIAPIEGARRTERRHGTVVGVALDLDGTLQAVEEDLHKAFLVTGDIVDIHQGGECPREPHTVYLALSSGLKVGVTRNGQIPTRWIDQGASQAIRLAEVPNRYLAGKIEVYLKDYLSDKTAWQRMLKNEIATDVDLLASKNRTRELLPEDLVEYVSDNDEITELEYPVSAFPSKVKSLSFDKVSIIEGTLSGIKGQYLMFSDERVLNIRKHSGYYIIFEN